MRARVWGVARRIARALQKIPGYRRSASCIHHLFAVCGITSLLCEISSFGWPTLVIAHLRAKKLPILQQDNMFRTQFVRIPVQAQGLFSYLFAIEFQQQSEG